MTSSTFIIRILRTDNGTWQGRIGHTQTGEMRPFKGCLEMLRLMDEIIGTKERSEEGIGRNAGEWPTTNKA
ncbi:MAG: hypothetical protein GX998_04395 [Firmicutes bacterium]|nr:hypothetical protein [Bacillota bacterium]